VTHQKSIEIQDFSAIPPSDFGIDPGDLHTSLNRAVARFISSAVFL
jgi:hypothetical protein